MLALLIQCLVLPTGKLFLEQQWVSKGIKQLQTFIKAAYNQRDRDGTEDQEVLTRMKIMGYHNTAAHA